jgi:hypothetical protein
MFHPYRAKRLPTDTTAAPPELRISFSIFTKITSIARADPGSFDKKGGAHDLADSGTTNPIGLENGSYFGNRRRKS